jgi:hypothetical protein
MKIRKVADLASCMTTALPLLLPAGPLSRAQVVQTQAVLSSLHDHIDGPEGPGGPQRHRLGEGRALEQGCGRRNLKECNILVSLDARVVNWRTNAQHAAVIG